MNKQEQIAQLKAERDRIDGYIKELEENKKWPQDGDWYYFLSSTGITYLEGWNPNEGYNFKRKSIGNCFETEQEAEDHLALLKWLTSTGAWKRLHARKKIQEKANELNEGWKPDWDRANQFKYYIYYHSTRKGLHSGSVTEYIEDSIYFISHAKAKQAIKDLGKKVFLEYMGVQDDQRR